MLSVSSRKTVTHNHFGRERFLMFGFIFGVLVVLSRLFYWQVMQGERLQAAANDQYERHFTSKGERGNILTADGYTLVSNERVFRMFAQPQLLTLEPAAVAAILAPIVVPDLLEYQVASDSADRAQFTTTVTQQLQKKLENKGTKWTSLVTTVSQKTKNQITELKLKGIGFDTYEKRYYPEASMAAHLTGFVGKDDDGNDIGYFGIEGALEEELKARSQKMTIMADAFGLPLPSEQEPKPVMLDGQEITLTIRRDIQNLAEQKLAAGIERYQAEAGEVVILEPKTGAILALAVSPSYDQRHFFRYPSKNYINSSLNSLYEPGSTFKILTVAAGIDAGVITPETECDSCAGPRTFGKYTIRTWNDSYNPRINMTNGLAKSDNTAMIFIAEKLGADKLKNYLQAFGIGEAIHLELQGDRKTPFPAKWGPVELATISFGQGISTTTLQLARAISAIANNGTMMRPRIIKSVTNWTNGQTTNLDPIAERQVISPATAQTVTKMMIESAGHGEAQWTASRTNWIAGKTGTSQIATKGGYEEDKTMASFVGFAPPDNPQFVMVVKLLAPQSSPWAAETAAPLWYNISKDLFLLLNIPPDRTSDTKTTAPTVSVGD